MNTSAIFLIESGKALDMVKEHIADRLRVRSEVEALMKEIGVEGGSVDRRSGVLLGVVFAGDVHNEFTKPKKRYGTSYPKKKTAWAARFAGQKGYKNQSDWIAEEFNIPLSVGYKCDGGEGFSCIGNVFAECGFLYLSESGPYAMWTPDVPAAVSDFVEQGRVVNEPAASFKLEFDGCRRIEKEEWEILVLQENLKKKQAREVATP